MDVPAAHQKVAAQKKTGHVAPVFLPQREE